MSTLAEIESAAEALPPEQQEALVRFLTARNRPAKEVRTRARLVNGPEGTLLLEASPDAPPMTTENVKRMLKDFP
jgi:uncharacterized membrane protein